MREIFDVDERHAVTAGLRDADNVGFEEDDALTDPVERAVTEEDEVPLGVRVNVADVNGVSEIFDVDE